MFAVCSQLMVCLGGKIKALAVTFQLTAKAFPLSFTIDGNLCSVLTLIPRGYLFDMTYLICYWIAI